MKKNIERYAFDLERNEFIIAEVVNSPQNIIAIDNGTLIDKSYLHYFDNDVVNPIIEPQINLKDIFNQFGFKAIIMLILFFSMIYFSLKSF